MKNLKTFTSTLLLLFTISALLFAPVCDISAQDNGDTIAAATDEITETTTETETLPIDAFVPFDLAKYATWENGLYHALVILGGYLSYLIPGLNKKRIPFRTIAIGLILIVAFASYKIATGGDFTVGAAFTYVLNFLVSTHAYDKIYKEVIGGSKKAPADAVPAV